VRVQDGLNGLRNVGADGGRIYALLTLGRLCLAGAPVQRWLEAVHAALALGNERGPAQAPRSDLFRIRAALLLAQSTDLEPEAEDLLMRAYDVARNQTARMHELRVVLDLAPLWVRAGRNAAVTCVGAVDGFVADVHVRVGAFIPPGPVLLFADAAAVVGRVAVALGFGCPLQRRVTRPLCRLHTLSSGRSIADRHSRLPERFQRESKGG